MSFFSKNDKSAKHEIKQRLLSGWVIVNGDDDLIEIFERAVYPPDTEKNSDFLLYFGHALSPTKTKVGYIYLARKNEDLRSFLQRFDNALSDDEWERVIQITLLPAKSTAGDIAIVITYSKEPTSTPKDISDFIDSFLN